MTCESVGPVCEEYVRIALVVSLLFLLSVCVYCVSISGLFCGDGLAVAASNYADGFLLGQLDRCEDVHSAHKRRVHMKSPPNRFVLYSKAIIKQTIAEVRASVRNRRA